jgi:single-strand DNA-binding protein
MAKDLNKVQLTGRLGADPEPRYTSQGSAVTTFRVASNRRWKSADGEDHEETEWFRIVAWNKLGEICAKYLTKGSRVYIEGRMQTRSWQDQEGQTRYTSEVIANDMIILDSRRENGGGGGGDFEFDAEPEGEADPAPAPARRAPSGGSPARSNASTPAPRSSTRPAPAPRAKPSLDEEDLPF